MELVEGPTKTMAKQWLVNCRGCIAQRCNFPGFLGRWSRTNVQEPQGLADAEIYAVHFSAERPRITLKIRNGKETGTQNCSMIYILPKLLAQSGPPKVLQQARYRNPDRFSEI